MQQNDLNLSESVYNRIVIFRALYLGDLLCAVPAFRALRAAFPTTEIALVGLPWAGAFVERYHTYIDRWIAFPGYPGLPEQTPHIDQVPAWLAAMQREQFDLAIQMHGSGSMVNELVTLWNAKCTAGYFLPGDYRPAGEPFFDYPANLPEIDRNLKLIELLGIPAQGTHLEFPLFGRDEQEFAAIAGAQHLLPDTYVCLHPGAKYLSRRWSPAEFARVGDALAARGWTIVLTGNEQEIELTQTVANTMRTPALNLAGRTSLGALGVLLRGARLVVCNDTGISHLADALNVRSVIVALSSDVARWSPQNRNLHRVIRHPIECSPCGFAVCPIGHLCVTSVSADEVIAEANRLLSQVDEHNEFFAQEQIYG